MKKHYDLNKLARNITLAEGGRRTLDIGQVKEVLRILCDIMGGSFVRAERIARSMRRNGRLRRWRKCRKV